MKINYPIILFFFVVFSGLLNAQIFGLDFDSKMFNSVSLPFPKDGNYRVLAHDLSYPIRPQIKPKIKIYDQQHQLVNTISLIRGISLNENPPLKLGQRLLWPCSYWDTLTLINPRFGIGVLELDTLYNVTALHKIGGFTDSTAIYSALGIVKLGSRLITGGFVYDTTSSTNIRTRLYKLDYSITKLDSVDYNSQFFLQSSVAYGNQFVATTDYLSNPCVVSAKTQKLMLDSNLSIVNCKIMDSLLAYSCGPISSPILNTISLSRSQGKAKALSATKIFVVGVSSLGCSSLIPFDYHEGITNCIISPNNQITKTNVLSNNNINTNFATQWNTPYAIEAPYILTLGAIGFTNVPSFPPPFYPYYFQQKSIMVINKIDTLGNLKWTKHIGGEMNYIGRGISFTSDGGCVIVGTRYDSTSMYGPHVSQNFLFKLDSAGNYNALGIEENSLLNTNQIICFPNPSHDKLLFKTPFESNYELKIYNSLGNIILQNSTAKDNQEIDVSLLDNNIYLFTLYKEGRLYSGKFLKQ